MQAQVKWYIKAYHILMVYLPVILVCCLICFIYFCYIFTYITILLNPSVNAELNTMGQVYPFLNTSSPESAQLKGKILLYVSTFSVTLLLICFFRTIFMDPGYFPSPLELESKVIMKNCKRKEKMTLAGDEEKEKMVEINHYKYIANFRDVVAESPLTFTEGVSLRHDISKHTEETNHNSNSNKNKNYFSLTSKKENVGDKDNALLLEVKETEIDPFDKYKDVDFHKLALCGTCLRLKTERSHHCRQCGRCVLKMDHHCPWLANCIGYRNYKYFCLIHLYGIICTLIIAFTYWEVLINHNVNFDSTAGEIFLSTFAYTSNLGLFSFLFWLFYINWRLVLTGQTVIENADRERFPSTKTINIYDLGYYKNFVTVFGTNPLVWFVPFFANYQGNGICFETNSMNVNVNANGKGY